MADVRALREMTWTEVPGQGRLLAVPLGSCEQHGPHLPLDTDTRVALACAAGLAAARDDVLVAPPLGHGASGEHAGFPGTLSLGTPALAALLVELVRSADDTADGVVLVNGHRGNTTALRAAAASAAQDVGAGPTRRTPPRALADHHPLVGRQALPPREVRRHADQVGALCLDLADVSRTVAQARAVAAQGHG